MHREHSTYSNPTCALRAPFASHTFHLGFDLCRAKEVSAQTPKEHSGDNPNVLTKQPTRTCQMTLTYLRGGLSTCSVVWVSFPYCFVKFLKILLQLCKKFLLKLQKLRLRPSSFRAVYAVATLFLESASVALVCDFRF